MAVPKKQIDWETAAELAAADCSGVEIASYFGVTTMTLYRRAEEDIGVKWPEFVQAHKDRGKALIRKAQYDKALKGNTMLLIWLGKQRLDQFDKTAIDMTTRHETVDLSQLTLDELKMMRDNPQLTLTEVRNLINKNSAPSMPKQPKLEVYLEPIDHQPNEDTENGKP